MSTLSPGSPRQLPLAAQYAATAARNCASVGAGPGLPSPGAGGGAASHPTGKNGWFEGRSLKTPSVPLYTRAPGAIRHRGHSAPLLTHDHRTTIGPENKSLGGLRTGGYRLRPQVTDRPLRGGRLDRLRHRRRRKNNQGHQGPQHYPGHEGPPFKLGELDMERFQWDYSTIKTNVKRTPVDNLM